jgi:hypothetical protein
MRQVPRVATLLSACLALVAPSLAPPGGAATGPSPLPLEAERLLSEVPPAELERRLAADRAQLPAVLTTLAQALAESAAGERSPVARYLVAVARARGARLGAAPPAQEVDELLTLLLVHPRRFAAEPAFRARVVEMLPRAVDPATPRPLREQLLRSLNELEGFDFEAAESVAVAWGLAPRYSRDRQVAAAPPPLPRADDDPDRPLAASLYSLPAPFFSAAEVSSFLAAVRALDGGRELLVLTDLPLDAAAAGAMLLPTYGRPFSPWPRDPLSLARRPDGAVAVLVRPNAQPGREEDLFLGRQLVQALPERLDRAWGHPTWTVAPTPFHNGQVLLSADTAWLTLHSLELRALELLGLSRVPVEELAAPAGIARYMEAVQRAADESSRVYGRSVRFAHPLPAELPAEQRPELMRRLGGGAGFDLDSLLTLVPASAAASDPTVGPRAPVVALVADVAAGRRLLADVPAAEWAAFRDGFGLRPDSRSLPAALATALETPTATQLADFLDLLAGHLAAGGLRVERLPVLVVPTALLADADGVSHSRFLITWNNVVVERRHGHARAEGFASLLPTADRQATAVFRRAGAELDLLPPLVRSIVLTGGYRCASNHLRQPATDAGG